MSIKIGNEAGDLIQDIAEIIEIHAVEMAPDRWLLRARPDEKSGEAHEHPLYLGPFMSEKICDEFLPSFTVLIEAWFDRTFPK